MDIFENFDVNSPLMRKLNRLFASRIYVGVLGEFFELDCCSDDAHHANVGGITKFASEYDGYVCGYLDCLGNGTSGKFHVHIKLVVPEERRGAVMARVVEILDGKLVGPCRCHVRRTGRNHHLDHTVEIAVDGRDVEFLRKWHTSTYT